MVSSSKDEFGSIFGSKLPRFDNEGADFGVNLHDYDESALLNLRALVDSHLPPMALDKMNLEHELALQFRTMKALQASLVTDMSIQPNQKAQVANSVAATLSQLTLMQNKNYTSERFKLIESVLIRVMRNADPVIARAFFDEYDRELRNVINEEDV